FLRPFSDRRDVLQLSAPVLTARAGAAGLARLAQKLDEFRAQATARIGIDVCVDRFVADALPRIVRIHDLQLASALLRRPTLAHPTQDPAPNPGSAITLRSCRTRLASRRCRARAG